MEELSLADIIPPAAIRPQVLADDGFSWPIAVGLVCAVALLILLLWMRQRPAYRLRRMLKHALAGTQDPIVRASEFVRDIRRILASTAGTAALRAQWATALDQLDEERFKPVPDSDRIRHILAEMGAMLNDVRCDD